MYKVERAVVLNIQDSMQATEAVVADSAIINSNILRLEDEIENQRRLRDSALAEGLKPLRTIDQELVRASNVLGLPTSVGAFSWDRADSTVVSRFRQAGDAPTQVVDESFFEEMLQHCFDGISALETIQDAAREALKELREQRQQDAPAVGGDPGGSGDGSAPGDDPAVGGDGGGLPPAAGTPPPRQETQQQSGTDPQHLPESSHTPADLSGTPIPRVKLVGMC